MNPKINEIKIERITKTIILFSKSSSKTDRDNSFQGLTRPKERENIFLKILKHRQSRDGKEPETQETLQ